MGSANKRNKPPLPTKTYAFFTGRMDDTANATHLDMEQMRLSRLKRSLYLFNQGSLKARTAQGSKMYAENMRSKGRYQPAFFTLTYDPKKHPDYPLYKQLKDWGLDSDEPRRHSMWHPRHITKFIDRLRSRFIQGWGRPREDFRYCWVAELHEDGVIHYHGVVWHPRGKSYDNEMWVWGSRNVFEGVKTGVSGYLMKYLSKGSIKQDTLAGQPARYFPKGCRIFGMGGLSSAERDHLRYTKLPRYVKDIFDETCEPITRSPLGWEQGKVELVSPWSYHKSQNMDSTQTLNLFNNLEADKIQAEIVGKQHEDFSFGLLEYNQTVWLLQDKAEYKAKLQKAKDIYNHAYDSATSIPCAYCDLPALAKRFLKLTESEYEIERLKMIAQIVSHTTNFQITVQVND